MPTSAERNDKIGIVGVGNMGGRMAGRVRDAGVEIAGYDRDPRQLEAAGIAAAPSLAELVAGADVVLLSLPDSTVIEPVVLGDDGILAHARDGQIVVDLSTASPSSTVRIHAALAERGVAFLDAGISGGAKAAEAGTLTLMVGGDADALEQVRPLLAHFSSNVFHMGGPGAGHTAKIVNNFLNGINLAATAEAMVAGRKAGLDPAQLLEVINASSGMNWASVNRFPHIVHGDYLEGGLTGKLMAKDLTLYLELVRDLGVPSFTGPATLAAFDTANDLGYGDQISNRIVDGIGDLAGGVRLHDDGEGGAA
jgi:3-hydroxyisobutyrate dehydrogenase-like beta-hydroxyacid dehydrogenase